MFVNNIRLYLCNIINTFTVFNAFAIRFCSIHSTIFNPLYIVGLMLCNYFVVNIYFIYSIQFITWINLFCFRSFQYPFHDTDIQIYLFLILMYSIHLPLLLPKQSNICFNFSSSILITFILSFHDHQILMMETFCSLMANQFHLIENIILQQW